MPARAGVPPGRRGCESCPMRLTADLRDLATVPAFRTLLGVRLVSQSGDGMVQAGLATLFFFQPQNMTDAAGVAAALVVMLLPFSVVGPFAGPFIDRWRRRRTLLIGNLVRAGLIAQPTNPSSANRLTPPGIGKTLTTSTGFRPSSTNSSPSFSQFFLSPVSITSSPSSSKRKLTSSTSPPSSLLPAFQPFSPPASLLHSLPSSLHSLASLL